MPGHFSGGGTFVLQFQYAI